MAGDCGGQTGRPMALRTSICHKGATYAQRLLSAASLSHSHSAIRVLNCFFLTVNCLLVYILLQGLFTLPSPESYFYPPITSEQRTRMLSALRDFHYLMSRRNVSYLMGAGTLLGSYRHHGPIPWDDDVDVFVLDKDRERTRVALTENLPSNMTHYRAFYGDLGAPAWKFYDSTSSEWFLQHSFRWPFVDIFFLTTNATHVWNENLSPKPRRIDHIFPLMLRPFADMWLPAPCNTEYVLDFLNVSECQNRAFSHLVGFSMPLWRQHRLLCHRLRHRYPFVNRRITVAPNGSRHSQEQLTIGNTVLYSLVLNLPKCGLRRS